MSQRCILILGGVRSGKSSFAQKLAVGFGRNVFFVATAEALDKEMSSRIEEHKRNRPRSWHTLEAPTAVGKEIREQIGNAEVVVIDCITMLISNLLVGNSQTRPAYEREQVIDEIEQLVECIDTLEATFIIVSNEVGMGLVPENRLGRLYRDELGKANQILAQHADEVYLMLAGIPIKLK